MHEQISNLKGVLSKYSASWCFVHDGSMNPLCFFFLKTCMIRYREPWAWEMELWNLEELVCCAWCCFLQGINFDVDFCCRMLSLLRCCLSSISLGISQPHTNSQLLCGRKEEDEQCSFTQIRQITFGWHRCRDCQSSWSWSEREGGRRGSHDDVRSLDATM